MKKYLSEKSLAEKFFVKIFVFPRENILEEDVKYASRS